MTKLNSAGMACARSLFLSSDIDRSTPSPGFIERKGAAIEFKFVSDGDPGVFEGYGGVFHNVDSYGDLILPGAFAASLAEYKAKRTMLGYLTGEALNPEWKRGSKPTVDAIFQQFAQKKREKDFRSRQRQYRGEDQGRGPARACLDRCDRAPDSGIDRAANY
jgi:hypothetical protein